MPEQSEMMLKTIKQSISQKPYYEDDSGIIYCADNRDILPGLPAKCASLVLTYPPYGLDKRLSQGGGKHRYKKFRLNYIGRKWDKLQDLSECFRVSHNQIIFGANYYSLPPTRGIIAWDKKQPLPTFSRWEYIWTNFDRPARMYELQSNEADKIHSAQKPCTLIQWLLKDYSQRGDIVLDPFGGSGTTAVAAKLLGRFFVLIEAVQEYCQHAKERLIACQTGLTPTEQRTGQGHLFYD